MKRALIVIAAVLVPVVVAVGVVLAFFIDWNVYKNEITARAMQATGREVAIDGDVHLAFFPAPSLKAEGVRVASIPGAADPDMVRLKELQVRVSLGQLLRGRVAVESLVLVEPLIVLERTADGRANWEFEPQAAAAAAPPAEAAESETARGEGMAVSIGSLRVEQGTVVYRDAAAGVTERVERLTAEVQAPSLAGPFAVSGAAQVRGMPVEVAVRTGRFAGADAVPVTASLASPEAAVAADLSGRLSRPDADGEFVGSVKLTARDVGRAVRTFAGSAPPVLNAPLELGAAVTVSRQEASLNDMAVRFGEVAATGAVNASFGERPRTDVVLKAGHVDLDKWLAQAAAAPASRGAEAPARGAPPAAGAAAGEEGGALRLPDGIGGSLDLTVDVVRYRGGVVREAALRATLAGGSVTVERAGALLPGGSDVSLLGFVQTPDGVPTFEGEASATSDDFRGLLRWLGADPSGLPADRLRGFSYASKVKATPSAVELNDLNVRLDAMTMTGGLAAALGPRPGFGLRLAIDRLNADAYLPAAAAPAAGQGRAQDQGRDQEGQRRAVGPAASGQAGPLAALRDFDADIDVSVNRLNWGTSAAEKVRLNALLVGGDLTVRNLAVERFAGLSLSAKGTALNVAGDPGISADVSATVHDPEAAFRFAAVAPPLPAERFRGAQLTGRLEGGQKAVSVDGRLKALDADLAVKGAVADPMGTPAFDLGLSLSHPQTRRLLAVVAPDYRPAVDDMGPLSVALRLTARQGALDVSDLRLNTAVGEVQGRLALDLRGARPTATADLTTSEIVLDLLLPAGPGPAQPARGGSAPAGAAGGAGAGSAGRWSGEPIDFEPLRALDGTLTLRMAGLVTGNLRLEEPLVDARLKDGRLDLARVTAGVYGGTLTGNGAVDARSGPAEVTASFQAENLELRQLARALTDQERAEGPVSATATLRANGRSQAEIVRTLNGTAAVSGRVRVLATEQEQAAVGALGIAGVLFGDKVRELRQVGDLSGVLYAAFGRSAAQLSGDIRVEDGIAQTSNLLVQGEGARALTTGRVDLPQWTIRTETAVRRTADGPPLVTASLSGALDEPNVGIGGEFLRRPTSEQAPTTDPLQQILPNILGRPQQQQQPPPAQGEAQPAPEKPRPEDILRGLLRGVAPR